MSALIDAFKLTAPAHQFKLKLSDPGKPAQSLTEKHRPKYLRDVVGQGEILFRLDSFLEAPYSAAFLFCGATGIGKTTVAHCVATELGACEFGGLEVVKSGMADQEEVLRVLDRLRFTPMLGSGWKVVVVDEADTMSAAASKIWLSALEDLPSRTVIVFTTNHPDKFQPRFIDRCERFDFQANGEEHASDAQTLIDTIWIAESGDAAAPCVQDLPGIVDAEGNISYRRVVRAMEPLLARVRSTPKPPEVIATLPCAMSPPEPAALTIVEPTRDARVKHDAIDWDAQADRFRAGLTCHAIGKALGIPKSTVYNRMKAMGLIQAKPKPAAMADVVSEPTNLYLENPENAHGEQSESVQVEFCEYAFV